MCNPAREKEPLLALPVEHHVVRAEPAEYQQDTMYRVTSPIRKCPPP